MCCFRLFKFDLDNGVVDSGVDLEDQRAMRDSPCVGSGCQESIHPDGEQFKVLPEASGSDSWEASEAKSD